MTTLPSIRSNPFHAKDIDSLILYEGRPSMAALVGSFFSAIMLAGAIGLAGFYPSNGLSILEPLKDEAAFALVEQYRWQVALGLIGIVVLRFLWRVVFLKSLSYVITNDRIRVETGVFSRNTDNTDLYRIKDFRMHRNLLDRLLGIGTVELFTSDHTDPYLRLFKVRNPRHVYHTIEKAKLEAERRRGVIHVS